MDTTTAVYGSKASQSSISSVLQEHRIFPPPAEFASHAHIKSLDELRALRSRAEANPVAFWEEQAHKLHWYKLWDTALDWNYPFAQWFVGGKINASYNCLDRHLSSWKRNKAALIWEGEPGEIRTLTYQTLHSEVCRFANVLKSLGVKRGDVVAIYMGMVPEAVVAMLACARIGATHNVVFGGFSADALRDRVNDSRAVCVVTQDGAFRRGTFTPLKPAVDNAVAQAPTVENVIVFRRAPQEETPMTIGRDHWWHERIHAVSYTCTPEELDAEHPLFILYTSGSTGKPKGIKHTTGGYLTQVAYTTQIVFDLRDEDLYFCTADIGWITGHSYVTYGPLMNGATLLMYEGVPTYPAPDRLWDMIERHRVTIFYTAPTAIRAFMKAGESYVLKHDLSSLRLLGTVGEPINPEAWMWYYTYIGGKRCPIVDTWWQTETGAIMISPVPGATPIKPGTATMPLPGILADVVRKDGTSCDANEGGYLVIKHPWPSMLRTVFGDNERYVQTYWSEFPETSDRRGYYFTGDGARKDNDGYIWIMGRVDDVVNVSGHRLGTAEVESALVAHPSVAEAAVVARPDDIKGSALVAFVTLKSSIDTSKVVLSNLKEELRQHVAKEIGHIAKPDDIRFSDALPKTRSGKIMRRLLREIASGNTVTGDTTTLEDFSVLEKLRSGDEE
ncbi:MAG: acetate--CoA ligase [Bacteroidota bacterium]|nr:acetate--CoA ligase [Candidatus Kapabacteria bacterium]MDW8220554.1 acetate--CoA ligase [Bacteroidota bacterium]